MSNISSVKLQKVLSVKREDFWVMIRFVHLITALFILIWNIVLKYGGDTFKTHLQTLVKLQNTWALLLYIFI